MANISNVREEIKQTRPFDSPRQEAVVALLRTAALLRRQIDTVTHAHDITGQQYNVLRILRGAGGCLPTMEVADRMIEPEPGITRMFGRLEAKGLVSRERCSEDGRRMLCSITQKGLNILSELDGVIDQLDKVALGDLSTAQVKELLHLLDIARSTGLANR